jgi:hypothetical protein
MIKNLLLALSITLLPCVQLQDKIYYVQSSEYDATQNVYLETLLDENGEAFVIGTDQNLTGQWLEGKSIRIGQSKDEYIFDFEIMP